MAQARDWRTVAALILSIGIRPCSGAVLILAFAHVMHLARTGIAAVLAMSAGTALSIATLALLAVKARDWSAAITGRKGRHLGTIGNIISLAGGLLIMGLGTALVMASLSRGHPLGL
jgi:ABC-type nickel/cobalt efflux system permease component RcnA